MTDQRRVLIGRSMAAIAVLGAVAGVVWLVVLGRDDVLWGDWIVHNALIAVGGGVVAWGVVKSQPRNAEIWVMAWAGVLTGGEVFLYALSTHALGTLQPGVSALEAIPSEVPLWLALVLMQVNWLWMGIFLIVTLGMLLFPDGRPPTKRWRWLMWAVISVVVLTVIGLFWEARPTGIHPLGETQDTNGGFRSLTASLVTVGYPLIFFLGLGCMAGLIVRYRTSAGVERHQFRWMAWGAGVAGAGMVTALLLDELAGRLDVSLYLAAISMAAILCALGIAIGKYRLYEIDTVISRTFVYGALAVFIGAVYVGIVVGIGRFIGLGEEPNVVLEILATVIIAIAFQPLRRQLHRLANRIVYGRRATPYEVLSGFSQRIASVDPEVLTQVARSLAEGTSAVSASISMQTHGTLVSVAAWPEQPDTTGAVLDDHPAAVTYEGEELGLVVLQLPSGQPLPEGDRRLLDQVAGGLGLAIRNLMLTEDLRARVEDLAASRRRIVAVQDETRRRLERDLHDGAQQRLVALKIKLGIGATMAEKAGLGDVSTLLESIKAETDQTIDSVRDFARGIYPPMLEAEGLGPALSARAAKMPIPVTVQAAGLGRYPKEKEATVYFCVLEALQNAAKHSEASSVQVHISESSGELRFEVRDDGVGFDPDIVSGTGRTNMIDRVEAVGGGIMVQSRPGGGTLIEGRLPVGEVALT